MARHSLKLLDLFSGAGGAAMGYHRAGFEIVGVDIEPQPHYPFEFVQADALAYCAAHGHEFDAIHASPPCQGYSPLAFVTNRDMSRYPKMVEQVRAALVATGAPYVIENVPRAPLINPLVLCGTMFGLLTHRHRAFEMSHPIYFCPAVCNKARVKVPGTGHHLGFYKSNGMVTVAGHMTSRKHGSVAMGIDWMTRDELAEAIPPAYTEYIGKQIIQCLVTR